MADFFGMQVQLHVLCHKINSQQNWKQNNDKLSGLIKK